MKPPTPAMLQILRYMRQNGSATEWLINPDVRAELEEQELIERDPDTVKPGWRRHYILTPAGRRVLAEHTTTGDE